MESVNDIITYKTPSLYLILALLLKERPVTHHRSKGKDKRMDEDDEEASILDSMFYAKPSWNKLLVPTGVKASHTKRVVRRRKQLKPMQEKQPSNESYSGASDAEWIKRAVAVAMAISGTDEQKREHEQLHAVGNKLREIRFQQCREIDEIATQTGTDARQLIYFESGWCSKQEFWDVIERWTSALGVDSDEYKKMLPPLK